MAFHVFTREISDWNKYFCHNVFQLVRIKPHWPGLTNVENSTSNFRQSFQICCREEEREGNNAICKGFRTTRKRNKDIRKAFLRYTQTQKCTNNFCQPVQNDNREGKRRKKRQEIGDNLNVASALPSFVVISFMEVEK